MVPAPVVFRLATPADAPTLTALRAAFQAYEPFPQPLPAAEQAAALHHLLGTPAAGRAWLLEVPGEKASGMTTEVAGYLVLTFGFSLEYGGATALLDELFLHPAYRGQGLGAQALAFLADYCRATGRRAVQLEVDRFNTAAQRLYVRHGFAGLEKRALLTQWLAPPLPAGP